MEEASANAAGSSTQSALPPKTSSLPPHIPVSLNTLRSYGGSSTDWAVQADTAYFQGVVNVLFSASTASSAGAVATEGAKEIGLRFQLLIMQ